jgi:hypothetical protein
LPEKLAQSSLLLLPADAEALDWTEEEDGWGVGEFAWGVAYCPAEHWGGAAGGAHFSSSCFTSTNVRTLTHSRRGAN